VLTEKERIAKAIEALEAQLKILAIQFQLHTDNILTQIAELKNKAKTKQTET
jgi:hypothetical protein